MMTRVGFVGAGYIAQWHAEALASAGARLDFGSGDSNAFTIQGDYHYGEAGEPTIVNLLHLLATRRDDASRLFLRIRDHAG